MSTTDKTYNGWSNYETWNVSLWMGNEEGSQRAAAEQAQDAYDEADDSDGTEERLAHASYLLATVLQNEYEDAMADVLERAGATSTVWSDLLGAALCEVNWREIADNLLVHVDKTAEAADDDE